MSNLLDGLELDSELPPMTKPNKRHRRADRKVEHICKTCRYFYRQSGDVEFIEETSSVVSDESKERAAGTRIGHCRLFSSGPRFTIQPDGHVCGIYASVLTLAFLETFGCNEWREEIMGELYE